MEMGWVKGRELSFGRILREYSRYKYFIRVLNIKVLIKVEIGIESWFISKRFSGKMWSWGLLDFFILGREVGNLS